MKFLSVLSIILLSVTVLGLPAVSQNWNSTQPGSSIRFSSDFVDGAYTWTFTNTSDTIKGNSPDYDVVAWTLQPFNITAPSYVQAPSGWIWQTSGYSRFEISDMSEKYTVGGAGLEPGESLIFRYTPDQDGKAVNKGGPADGKLVFSSHVGAVIPLIGGEAGDRWVSTSTPLGSTWHEGVQAKSNPEPSGIAVILIGLTTMSNLFIKKAKSRRSASLQLN